MKVEDISGGGNEKYILTFARDIRKIGTMRELMYAADPNYIRNYLEAKINARESELIAARAAYPSMAEPGSDQAVDEIFSRTGDTAIITVSGPLSMAGPDPWDVYMGYGGTSYQTIIAAITRAAHDPGVATVICPTNTPGGEVNGADLTWQAMKNLKEKKPVLCQVSGMLASAGYYIMSPVKIAATSPTDEIGSIGVIIAGYDFTEALDQMGIRRVEIRSSNAPNKALGLDSKKGRDVLQERVDATERIFYQRISKARVISPAYIRENFGQGALLVASDPDSSKPDALRAKLIDSLDSMPGIFPLSGNSDDEHAHENTPAVAGTSHMKEVHKPMNLSEFMAQGPAAVAEIEKVKADAATAAVTPINARIAKCTGFLRSQVYAGSEVIRGKALDAIEGKASVDALDGAVGFFDMQAERDKQNAADTEQGGQKPTPPGSPNAAETEAADRKAVADGIASFWNKEATK